MSFLLYNIKRNKRNKLTFEMLKLKTNDNNALINVGLRILRQGLCIFIKTQYLMDLALDKKK